jgi:hypothetical protein
MPLVQIVITWDEIVSAIGGIGNIANASNIPITFQRQVNLYGGPYRAKVDGVNFKSGDINTTTYEFNPQLLILSSSKFVFPASGVNGLFFSNAYYGADPCVKGHREFNINNLTGNIDITIQLNQYGTGFAPASYAQNAIVAPYTLNAGATWQQSNLAFLTLELDVDPINEQLKSVWKA